MLHLSIKFQGLSKHGRSTLVIIFLFKTETLTGKPDHVPHGMKAKDWRLAGLSCQPGSQAFLGTWLWFQGHLSSCSHSSSSKAFITCRRLSFSRGLFALSSLCLGVAQLLSAQVQSCSDNNRKSQGLMISYCTDCVFHMCPVFPFLL